MWRSNQVNVKAQVPTSRVQVYRIVSYLQCDASTEHTLWRVLVFLWQPRTGDHLPVCTCLCNWGLIGACFR
uniref:Uncharacterized protein n=1 Tax=Mesocestoides corti TaxID=53468 RepID=A0A5K3G7C4_MESCO